MKGSAIRAATVGVLARTGLVLLLSACKLEPGAARSIESGDAELYAAHVQPYLELRCASLDCHGMAGRPLRLYSELGLRREPALRSTPIGEHNDPGALTELELQDNQRAFAAISAPDADAASHLALKKPLALSAGGIAHQGGVHWPSTRDPGYRCLHGYLVSGARDDIASECTRALDATLEP